ncbi:MAG: hypothetical protein QXH07_02450 [Thermoplasmata archaeon]
MNNDEILKRHNDSLAYKALGAFSGNDERNPYTWQDVVAEINKMLDEARADEKANLKEEQ